MNPGSLKPVAYFVAMAIAGGLAACSGSDNETSSQSAAVPADNSVTDGDKTVAMQTSWKGSAVKSFTQRGEDDNRVGYFIDNGQLIAANSLLADSDSQPSTLDLNITANGEAFSACV